MQMHQKYVCKKNNNKQEQPEVGYKTKEEDEELPDVEDLESATVSSHPVMSYVKVGSFH